MALSLSQTVALRSIPRPGMVVASMGYPDIVAAPKFVAKLARDKLSKVKYREDSAAICKRHGIDPPRDIPDANSLFRALECELDVYDIIQERGGEILCDLNRPMNINEAYDIVLDVGTLEHCFNIAQAMANVAAMVKKGGVIIHENPFLAGNHGFYSLNPTWYADFYGSNGFELVDCRIVTRDGRGSEVPHTKRFRYTGEEINVFALAVRKEVRPFVCPIQSKYCSADAGIAGEKPKEAVNG